MFLTDTVNANYHSSDHNADIYLHIL